VATSVSAMIIPAIVLILDMSDFMQITPNN